MRTQLLNAPPLWFTLCLMVILFLSSCNKDNDANPNPKPDPDPITIDTRPTCRMTKFYNSADPTEYTIFQYDNQERLLQSTGFYKGKEKAVETYEYNQQGHLIKLTRKDKTLDKQNEFTIDYLEVITFEYNLKGQVTKFTKVTTSGTNSPTTFEVTCEYDNEGNRIKMSQIISGSTTPYVMMFTYKDGNCIKADYGVGMPNGRVEEYEYYLDQEDKRRQFYLLTSITDKTPSKNIIKKMVSTSKQSADYNQTVEYTHEFNNQGFPTKHIIVYTAKTFSSTITNLVEYECR